MSRHQELLLARHCRENSTVKVLNDPVEVVGAYSGAMERPLQQTERLGGGRRKAGTISEHRCRRVVGV